MKVKAKDFIFLAEIFVSLILFQIMFSNFTMGFNPTPYWGAEMAIVGLVSLSVASLIFFVRIALPGKAGKIGYGIIMGATTVLFAAQEVYYALFGTFFTVYSMINSAQITEFMDVIFINMWEQKIPLALFFALGIIEIVMLMKNAERRK